MKSEQDALKPNYDKIVTKNKLYIQKKNDLQNTMIKNGQLTPSNFDFTQLDCAFDKLYPEHKEFIKEYKQVTENYRKLIEQIQNLTNICNKIISYNQKIEKYFGV